MCNKMVEEGSDRDPVKIRETGIGWKIFRVRAYFDKITYEPYIQTTFKTNYISDEDGWINYLPALGEGDGFCFFRSEIDAHMAKDFLHYGLVKKIEYKGGLQERDENNFVYGSTFRVALCKAFRIVEE